MEPIVISISGPSGAGKSSLMENIVEELDNSVSVYFDAYQSTLTYPKDAYERLKNGGIVEPHEIRNDKFLEDLTLLKYGVDYNDAEGRAIKILFERIKDNADLILDGLKPKDQLVKELLKHMKAIS